MATHDLLSDSSYSDATFKRIELKDDRLTASEFSECRFVRCDFSGTTLESCRFIDCDFEDCSMQMTTVENTTFARVSFTRCNLMGVNWTEANWSDWAAKMNAMTFDECDLKYGVFLGLELQKLKLMNCNAREANFAEADLAEADFSGTDLAGAVFLRTNLAKANFVGAKHYTLNIHDNKTAGTRFSLPEAIRLLYSMNITIIDPETNKVISEEQLNDYIS